MEKKRAAKKASKKNVSKKKTGKKATKKKPARKSVPANEKAARAAATAMKDIIARARDHFRQAPAEHVFVLANGQVLRDLKELAEAFEEMNDSIFCHHVSDDNHDFANWVHEILHERALAEQLREAEKEQSEHQNAVYKHIVRRVW